MVMCKYADAYSQAERMVQMAEGKGMVNRW
jgi:hypothetical protein